jgi:diketogulonate reductase-like aldo/keto reductase
MDTVTIEDTVTLANGKKIPLLGFGVWKMKEGKETEDAVATALTHGYRHIDTARLYANERSVGDAVRNSGIPREDIFITTKLWPSDYLRPEKGLTESLESLGLSYVDLYLIHWPIPLMPKKVWQTLEDAYERGLVRAIGVSNYSQSDIEKVLEYAKVVPMVNQVEFNPKNYDPKLLAYCKDKNIVVEAYSPLGQGSLLHNSVVLQIASEYKKTPAQILIRYSLEHGTVPLPKSSNPERIKENAEVFDFSISPKDMERLDALS